METFKRTIQGTVAALLLGGCAVIQPVVKEGATKSAFVVMKTPVLRYADQGFVREEAGATKLEIYASGVAVMKLSIEKNKVCNGTGLFSCMSKKEFNARYLSASYPEDTFENILKGEPIFEGKNLQRDKESFSQKIVQGSGSTITYTVSSHAIVFHDTLPAIVIKVRENR